MKNEKAKLQKEIGRLREKLSTIEYNEAADQNAHLFRKTYKYRNNYSCPEKPSDYWFLYARVVAVDGNNITLATFQKDKYGALTFEPKSRTYGHLIGSGYQEISEKEFQKAWSLFKRDLGEL